MPSKVTAGGVAFQTNWAAILRSIFLRKKEPIRQIDNLYEKKSFLGKMNPLYFSYEVKYLFK